MDRRLMRHPLESHYKESAMPSFLNPIPAVIAGAVAAGLLLALYFLKLRRREMEVSSTLLWRKAIQDLQVNAPFQRLRRNLLLLLQLLVIALLALALSRPVMNRTPQAGSVNVILIDRSASMNAADPSLNGRTRLDEAKRQAADLVSTLKGDSAAAVIAFDASAELMQTFTSDPGALRGAIDRITPTDRSSRIKIAYKLAEAQAYFDEQQRRSTVRPAAFVYSDGRMLDSGEASIQADVTFNQIGDAATANCGIVALNAKRSYERPAEVEVFARCANFGPAWMEANVRLSVAAVEPGKEAELEFRIMRSAQVQLIPERWTPRQRDDFANAQSAGEHPRAQRDSVSFSGLDLTTAAVIKVELLIPGGDALGADDAAYVVVPPPKPLRVMLVTEHNYFLQKLMSSLDLKDPLVCTPEEYEAGYSDEENGAARFDVILFDRYAPKKPDLLPAAGNFIWFGVIPDFLSIKAKEIQGRQVILTDNNVLDWDRDHPILTHMQLGRMLIGKTLQLEPAGDDRRLMEGTKAPLIVLNRDGRRTNLVIAFDSLESDWPLRVTFPIFMSNTLRYLALGEEMALRSSLPAGATPRIARAALQKIDPGLTRLSIKGPNGLRIDVPIASAGDVALPALDRVGVYTLSPAVPRYEHLAVNLLDANESNILPPDREHLPGGIEPVHRDSAKARVELWWWLMAAGALPLLLVEWWVYTRRVHL